MQEQSLRMQAPAFRQVHSGHATQWWGSAWRLLFNRGAAAVWIGMCLIALIILTLLHLLPVLGSLAAQIGWFVFAGGLMLAARKTEQRTVPSFSDLFAGFGPPLGPLAIGGVLVMIGVMLVAVAASVAGLGAAAGVASGWLTGSISPLAALASLGTTTLLVALVALLVLIPIFMAGWLAPALIVLRQVPPVEALKASLGACWVNLGPLTVYGLLWIVFAIVACIPAMLGWLILAPLMVLSTYAAYRDLFEAQDAPA